jgi:hypothetical protein
MSQCLYEKLRVRQNIRERWLRNCNVHLNDARIQAYLSFLAG